MSARMRRLSERLTQRREVLRCRPRAAWAVKPGSKLLDGLNSST